MARYTGPKTKIARKFGEAIFGEAKYLSYIYRVNKGVKPSIN